MTAPRSKEGSPLENVSSQDLLCHCDEGVRVSAFVQTIYENPEFSFESVCDRLNLGRRCTACLLNAESTFTDIQSKIGEARHIPEQYKAPRLQILREVQQKSLKGMAFDLVDRVMPPLSIRRYEVAPIFARPGLKTMLGISNLFPQAIGPKSAPFRVRFRCVTSDGQCFRDETFELPVGERREFDLCEEMPGISQEGEFVCGSCWIEMDALDPGCNGSTRPHFSIKTEKACTPLHTQAANPLTAHVLTARHNPSERQFISYVNLSGEPARALCRVAQLGADECEFELERMIPPFGSELLECPRMKANDSPVPHYCVVTVETERAMRRHFMLTTDTFERVSVDHL